MIPTRPVWAEISRSRLTANWKLLRAAAPVEAELVAVIKADAYGHGAAACAPVLAAAGAEWFGVTCVEEAVALRQVSSDSRILVMSGLWCGEAEAVIEHRLSPQVWEPLHFDLLEEAARTLNSPPQSVRVQLEIDSGMSRQGVRSFVQLKELLARITPDSPIQIEGVMTHFSAPEILQPDETAQQLERFAAALDLIAECGIHPRWIHAGNSTTLLAQHHTPALLQLAKRHNARLMLRPGIALYGYPVPVTPQEASPSHAAQKLTPVLAWKTRIVSVRTIEPGETAGYNMTFKARRPTRLDLIPVGYADGLNRLLSNRGHALVRGQRALIAGRVSMDQTILDVTDISGVEIGDEVVLIGEQGQEKITATDLADLTGTISYEVLCAIGARVPRVMID
ncbi:alanine racemase [Acidobacterium sp. S8]|uniref:alanine racemase n=1 Tax=Acidobacterium sp. S8 TaxID=1641854 RepID=UPI00131CE8BB|nr:alanine racemase [Acidobacterium sp. S8]